MELFPTQSSKITVRIVARLFSLVLGYACLSLFLHNKRLESVSLTEINPFLQKVINEICVYLRIANITCNTWFVCLVFRKGLHIIWIWSL